MKRTILLTVIVICLLTGSSFADVPDLINYQGVLTDSTGTLLDGSFDITFRLYGQAVGGADFWTEAHLGIAVSSGSFSVKLGSMTSFLGLAPPGNAFWMGITVETDPEISPRTQLVSVPFAFMANEAVLADTALYAFKAGSIDTASFAFSSLNSDTAGVSASVFVNSIGSAEVIDNSLTASDLAPSSVTGSELAAGAVNNSKMTNNSIGSAEVIDNSLTASDLAPSSVAGSELAAGAVNNSKMTNNSIGSAEVINNSLINADINLSAAIDVTKISGTAVNLSSTQKITGQKQFGDSTMKVNNIGIRIGDNGAPSTLQLIRVERNYNTAGTKYGYWSTLDNQGAGTIIGVRSDVTNNGSGFRYAFFGSSGDTLNTLGTSYGVFAFARGGVGTNVYGVFGQALGASTNKFAGFFLGNVHVTGTLSKAAGAFKIDHPLDPANKYLVHSFVESPDMMNIYNGNVTTDGNGDAVVTLPDYFDALNKDFRYQLTVLGQFAQAIVSQKVSGNQFSIRTDLPNVEVSWQITGVRKDAYAEAHRIQVEPEKPIAEKGLYLHPVELGLSETKQLHYEMHKNAELERERIASESTLEQ